MDLRELILGLRGPSFGPERTHFWLGRVDLKPERSPEDVQMDRRSRIQVTYCSIPLGILHTSWCRTASNLTNRSVL